jgi:hypothetical protein
MRGPRSSPFWLPRNLSNHMDTGLGHTGDTVLVINRERTYILEPNIAVVARGRRGKDDRKQKHWPRRSANYKILS